MPLLLAGIDEAGYGPTLGPLCVGMSLFRIRDWSPGDPAPDLWKLLSKAVCKKPGDRAKRIPIADSKALKLPNDTATRHPLIHLERGLSAFLRGLNDSLPPTDQALFARLGVTLDDRPWYAGPPTDLPLGSTPGELAIAASRLAGALDAAGVELLDLRCLTIPESTFNQIIRETGSKAEATSFAVAQHLRHILASAGATARESGGASAAVPAPGAIEGSAWPPSPPGGGAAVFGGGGGSVSTLPTEPPPAETQLNGDTPHVSSSSSPSSGVPDLRSEISNLKSQISDLKSGISSPTSSWPLRIICDQLGGRTQYEPFLARELNCAVSPLCETGERSRYQIAPDRIVQFMPEAESHHLPVALASMAAKFVRELAMLRFNRYWCARCPELKPTAGYSTDARRWLADMAQTLHPDERAAMVRLA